MHREAIELFRMLINAGAVPGKDFSCDAQSGGYLLSQHSLADSGIPPYRLE